MQVNWVIEAKRKFYNTLDYWEEHNGSFDYSFKIMKAVEELEKELAENPYFLATYSKEMNLYRKFFLNGRFVVYYRVDVMNNTVEIRDFRSHYQRPLF